MKPISTHDFSKGVKVTDEAFDEWREEMLDYFRKHKKARYRTVATGNSFMLCTREEKGEVVIREVHNGYIESTFILKSKNK